MNCGKANKELTVKATPIVDHNTRKAPAPGSKSVVVTAYVENKINGTATISEMTAIITPHKTIHQYSDRLDRPLKTPARRKNSGMAPTIPTRRPSSLGRVDHSGTG